MNREQVRRKIRSWCKARCVTYGYNATEGDGSHGMIYVGDRKTTAKHGEWTKIYLEIVLKQLGIPKNEI